MKKILSIFGSLGLVATPIASLTTSCSKPLKVPVFNESDGPESFSKNWNFVGLKTVSLFLIGTSTKLVEKDLNEQLINLIEGRFDNFDQVGNFLSGAAFSYFGSNSDKSKIDFANISSTFEGKKYYFKVTKNGYESGFMDFYVSSRPSIESFENSVFWVSNNIDKNNSFLAWRSFDIDIDRYNDIKSDYQSQVNNQIWDDFASFSKISFKDGTIMLMKDYFVPDYKLVKSQFGIKNFASECKNADLNDFIVQNESKNGTEISIGGVVTLKVQNY